MINNRILDTSNNCSILNGSLLEDLLPYTIPDNASSISFADNLSYPINSKFDNLNTLFTAQYPNPPKYTWLPILVKDDTYIDNKVLSSDGSFANSNTLLTSGSLGIENFYKFKPSFKTLSASNGDMVVDWILNRPNNVNALYYGILAWVKIVGPATGGTPSSPATPPSSPSTPSSGPTINPIQASLVLGEAAYYQDIPIGSRVTTATRPGQTFIKIDEHFLMPVLERPSSFNDRGTLEHRGTVPSLIPLSSLGTNPMFLLDTADINLGSYKVHLWIPNGDMFCFYGNDAEKTKLSAIGIPSKSYISAGLYNYYTQLYRIFTLDEIRTINPKLKLSRSRCFKKLAHLFSSSPFISDFAINAMDHIEIKLLINEYILAQEASTSIDTEIDLLKTYTQRISEKLQTITKNPTTTNLSPNNSLFLDTKPSPYSFNNNLVTSKKQLFVKLLQKYGASLQISADTILSKKAGIKIDNTGIVVTQVTTTLCPKGTTNTIVFNNQDIKFDTNTISTDIGDNKSNINLITGGAVIDTIPLYDAVKAEFPGIDKTEFLPRLTSGGYIDKDYTNNNQVLELPANNNTYIYQTYNTSSEVLSPSVSATIPLAAVSYEPKTRINETYFLPEKYLGPKITYLWSQLSGPKAKFKNPRDSSSTATDTSDLAEPELIVSDTGIFVIQCQVITPFGSFIKPRTIYVVDGGDKRGTKTLRNPDLTDNADNKGKYFDRDTNTWIAPPNITTSPEFTALYLNKDNLRVHCPTFDRFAISNIGGVFWPINTNMLVKEFLGLSTVGRFSVPQQEVTNLNANYKFNIKSNKIYADDTNFALVYKPNNTIIKIHSIILEKIRSDRPECANCLSLYEPSIVGRKASIITGAGTNETGVNRQNVLRYTRYNKSPAGFTLYKYLYDTTLSKFIETDFIEFIFPVISTDFAPPIKTYGGYDTNFLNQYAIPRVSGLELPTDPIVPYSGQIVSQQFKLLPKITGHNLSYINTAQGLPVGNQSTHKMCYQKALPATTGGVLTFTKGVFHPTSGWIGHNSPGYSIHANRSSILKFNPGARDSFSFVGPKLQRLSSGGIILGSSAADTFIKTKEFSSSIVLGISDGVQWDAGCIIGGEGDTPNEMYNKNQLNKEYADIDSHNRSNHAYRYLAAGQPKGIEKIASNNLPIRNDEFDTYQDDGVYRYSFAVTGPYSLPENIVSPDGRTTIRIPRVNNFGIKNVEVKLNFLNYVNTKNLIVRLDILPAPKIVEDRSPPPEETAGMDEQDMALAKNKPPRNPIRIDSFNFIDSSVPPRTTTYADIRSDGSKKQYRSSGPITDGIAISGLSDYIQATIDTHGGSGLGAVHQNPADCIILLNQEHIQNNKYNFSIKFSDNAPKYNVLYDHNIQQCPAPSSILDSVLGPILVAMSGSGLSNIDTTFPTSLFASKQKIITSSDEVNPSNAAINYSDRQACFYTSIMKYNKININNNTLSKLAADTLFKGYSPPDTSTKAQRGRDLKGSTEFKLTIIVVDEEDDMSVQDNIINSQYLAGIEDAENKQKSSDIFNSLCSWELILHVGDTEKFVPYSNPSLDSYGNCDILSLIDYGKDPSYPGNSYIADLTNHKALLPLANINAPRTLIADSSYCYTGKPDDINQGLMLQNPDFPTYAIVNILASIAVGAGMMAGFGLAGIGVALDTAINSPGYQILFNYLQELSFIAGMQDAGRQIYFPSFMKYPFGSPEKVLINFRKPQDLWHSLEATIFKYSNMPILKPNRYNFVRVRRNFCDSISTFKFSIISDINFFVDNSLYKYIQPICGTTLTGAPAIISDVLCQEGDLVYASFVSAAGATTQCPDETGVYIVQKGSWIRIKDKPKLAPNATEQERISNDNAWRTQNNYGDLKHALPLGLINSHIRYGNDFFSNSLYGDMLDAKVIAIDSRIPYDIFSIGDTIELYTESNTKEPDDSTEILRVSIINKALIYKKNKLVSVLILSTGVGKNDRLSPSLGNKIFFVYKNNPTSLDNTAAIYNTWGLDKNSNYSSNSSSYDIIAPAHSTGSYGDISPFISKNYLYNNISFNKLKNIYQIFNNSINDKIKFNTIKFWTYNDKLDLIPASGVTGGVHGFAYSADVLQNSIFDSDPNVVIADTANARYRGQRTSVESEIVYQLQQQLRFSTSNTNEDVQDFMYIKLPSFNDSSLSGLYGVLEIENDYVEYIPIKPLDNTDFNNLKQRILTIDNDSYDAELESKTGDENFTTDIINSKKIKYIAMHLDKLSKKIKDKGDCHSRNPSNPNQCYILRTSRALDRLYKERHSILTVLNTQTLPSANVTYIDPDTQQNGSANGEIIYENKYYITIKPVTADSDPVKIFKNKNTIITRDYIPTHTLRVDHPKYANTGILPKLEPVITTDNGHYLIDYKKINQDHYMINIDPSQGCICDFASNPKILISTEYSCVEALPLFKGLRISNNICPDFARNESIGDSGPEKFDGSKFNSYKYTIPQLDIDRQKTTFEQQFNSNIKDWKTIIIERWFNINGDEIISGIPNDELTVHSIETYLVPVPYYEMPNPTLLGDDKSSDINAAPGYIKCFTDTGSPAGNGLISDITSEGTGNRRGKPTRVGNLLNLTTTNSIEVIFKRIPRQLRGCDLLSTVYRYGSRAGYRASSAANPLIPLEIDSVGRLGTINNNLYYWISLQKNANNNLEYTELPDFFKLQNEMIFRSFYGSVDKIENKGKFMSSYFPWELIPYEYGTK
jgi:hypothetical protein